MRIATKEVWHENHAKPQSTIREVSMSRQSIFDQTPMERTIKIQRGTMMFIPTRKAICDALETQLEQHSMDRITVSMVCSEAGISRQTLYNHYYSLIDVLNDLLIGKMKTAVADHDTYLTWERGFESILTCLEQNRELIQHVYRSASRTELLSMIERFGGSLIDRGIADCAKDMRIEVDAEDQAFMLRLYLSAFMGIIDYWFSQDMQLSPAYLTSRCNAMMALSIRGTIKRLKEMRHSV